MAGAHNRRLLVLAGLLLGAIAVAGFVLLDVLSTVFFAITVAYVLYPVRRQLVERGLPVWMASAAVAAGAFGLVLVLIAPLVFVLYRRRQALVDLLREIPQTVEIPVGEFTYVVEATGFVDSTRTILRDLAISVASAAPVLALQLFLFAILLYALLLRPTAAGKTVLQMTPPEYHDVVRALDARIRETLFGIYVLQAATSAGTFVVAFVVFLVFGYSAPFTLAVIAAVLQFVPIVGPGVLIAVLTVVELLTGNITRAVLFAVIGAVFIGLAPDAIIRPRLAEWAADLPMSLYFIGFTGGLLTVGPIGFIAGPLAVALLVEVVSLLVEEEATDVQV